MAMDLWFKPDVARILASKAQAASRYSGAEYKRGYMDALADVALAFGLTTSRVVSVEADLTQITDRIERSGTWS